ncbi:uncharacterized protein RHOBADRAFT_44869 [Rhodotorula graminis WP1]|uniref:Uncharacterized protein n=1 Tax=Rhodotorula graminis (strain WP1) TaxID=578459 RepID=A0A194S0X1_RHOGW|nr:uncharacterized protein RHOBADRAFT_44869 [Rhodotorula graminis WP1]KPV74378.1 hypothetical protein RHOBADRAFT_44869 [Rhodotorula graminis WP1]
MLHVLNTSLRRVRSFRSTSPSRTTSPPPADSRRPYTKLRRRLEATLAVDAPEWSVLTAAWLDALGREEVGEVLSWAKRVKAVRENTAEQHPHVPHFLEHALARATARSASSSHDHAAHDADADDVDIRAAEFAVDHLPNRHRQPHVQRAIGHRAARIYGTTKERWEAGRGR